MHHPHASPAPSGKPAERVTLLTDRRYTVPKPGNAYVENIFAEDDLLTQALQRLGIHVHRTHWDDPTMDWTSTGHAIFRTTWDYFDRFAEFSEWLDRTAQLTRFLNPLPLVRWNMDKHYLADLAAQGIPVVPTHFIEQGDPRDLAAHVADSGWQECILKPAISGAARHTYRFLARDAYAHANTFLELVRQEAMLLQQFLPEVLAQGETTYVVIGGRYTHAIRKHAKPGDFRVQDDFGGTVHHHEATAEEAAFAERVIAACPYPPLYGRVDVLPGADGQPLVSEVELIEPELWMRFHPAAAGAFAKAIHAAISAVQRS